MDRGSSEDKRSSKRIGRKFMMRVAPDDGNPWPSWSLVTTQDLSAGGALFTFDQAVTVGKRLFCKLHFADHIIDCKATVIRFTGQKGLVEVAVTFEWASEKDRQAVETFAKLYLEKKS